MPPVASQVRAVGQGNAVRQGFGETRPEPNGPGKTDPEPRDESTPGAAPRETIGRHADHRRRALDQREPLPTRVEETEPLPAAYEDALGAGLADLGLQLEPAQRAALDGHVRLLLVWNRAMNLTAIRDPARVALLHVVDSLAAVALIQGTGASRFLDLGSGGGYPGIPLAVALPPITALLVESTGKKARFLETVIAGIGMDEHLSVAAARAEALAAEDSHRERWPVVTARAVANLPDLVELAFPLLEPGGRLIAWKRGDLRAELAATGRAAAALGGGRIADHVAHGSVLPGHRLIAVTKRSATPAGYPRDPAARARRPW